MVALAAVVVVVVVVVMESLCALQVPSEVLLAILVQTHIFRGRVGCRQQLLHLGRADAKSHFHS